MAEQFNSLVEAKKEWIGMLARVMAPHVLRAFKSQYEHAKGRAESFRVKMRAVKQWNALQIQEQTDAVTHRCPYFKDLIKSAFVTTVKIMSTVRLRRHEPIINLRVPPETDFVHKVFTEAAKAFYYDPGLIASRDTTARFEAVREAVRAAVRDLLPYQEILSAYLGDAVDQDDQVRGTELTDVPLATVPLAAVPMAPTTGPATAEQLQHVRDLISEPMHQSVVPIVEIAPPVAQFAPPVAQFAQPVAQFAQSPRPAWPTQPARSPATFASPVKTIRVPGAFVTPESPGLFDDAGEF